MAVLINVIVLAILFAAAVGIVWAAWALVSLVFAKRRMRWVLLGLPVAIAVVVLAIGLMWFRSTRPEAVFEREFGFPLPSDSTILESSSSALGDSGSAFVHFRTSPNTVSRIVAAGYVPADSSVRSIWESPSWYKPADGPSIKRYLLDFGIISGATRPASNFATERRELTYDPATDEVWYSFSGVD